MDEITNKTPEQPKVVTENKPITTEPTPPPQIPHVDVKPRQSFAPYIAIGVLLVIVIIVSFFIFQETTRQKSMEEDLKVQPTTQVDVPRESPKQEISTSDEIEVLESDINATDIGGVDQELNLIDQESAGL